MHRAGLPQGKRGMLPDTSIQKLPDTNTLGRSWRKHAFETPILCGDQSGATLVALSMLPMHIKDSHSTESSLDYENNVQICQIIKSEKFI